MRRSFLIVIMIILAIILASCSVKRLEVEDRIIAPNNSLPPIKGKWIIEKVIDSPYKKVKLEEPEHLIDKQVLFHSEAVVVADQYILEPSYKIRNVNLSDYLLYKFKIDRTYLGIDEEEAEVITVLGNNQYFYEFIKYSEEEMIMFTEEKFLMLKRSIEEISKEEIDRYINIERNILRTTNIKEIESLNSGVLLGIKTYGYDEVNEIEEWEYRTVWIKSNDRTILSVYGIEDLLVPRKKGFWLIDIERENIEGTFIDRINSTPRTIFNEEAELDSAQLYSRNIGPSILRSILYIGNDYISTEVIDKSTNKKTLEVYAIDNLDKGPPTIFSDLVGKKELKSFEDEGQEIFKSDSDLLPNEKSFGLVRRNGYWAMKGRINYNNQGKELYKDFNIKTIPPKELVNYDDLCIPWSNIKSRFPNAVDAFTSPNEDIIIIDTRNYILIYPIEDNEISQHELGKIKKDHTDTIVMAEWSTGRYTNLWEEEMLKNNGEPIVYR